jgi:hypothetical protein
VMWVRDKTVQINTKTWAASALLKKREWLQDT